MPKVMLKQCSSKSNYGCGVFKPLSRFFKNKKGQHGVQHICKSCAKKFNSQYQKTAEGKQAHKKSYAKWALRDESRNLLRRCGRKYRKSELGKSRSREFERKKRATRKGQTFNLPDDYWEILLGVFGDSCMNPKCSTPLSKTNVLSLDHIIPLSKYKENNNLHSMNNFQILCRKCNASKGNRHSNDYRPFKYYYLGEQ